MSPLYSVIQLGMLKIASLGKIGSTVGVRYSIAYRWNSKGYVDKFFPATAAAGLAVSVISEGSKSIRVFRRFLFRRQPLLGEDFAVATNPPHTRAC